MAFSSPPCWKFCFGASSRHKESGSPWYACIPPWAVQKTYFVSSGDEGKKQSSKWWGPATMTGAEDVAFSCVLNSVILNSNDVFSPFFPCWRGCSGHGTEAQSSVSLFIHNLPFIHECLQLKCWVSGMHQFGPAASSALLDGWAHCWGWPQSSYPAMFEPAGSEAVSSNILGSEVLWVTVVSLNTQQLRKRTPEVWYFSLVQLSLVDEQKLPAFPKWVWTSSTST